MDWLTVDAQTKRRLLQEARCFRKRPTQAEAVLWQRLRCRQLGGLRVRRQQPVGPFIVDFFVPVSRLVIEIDGGVHDDEAQRARDAERQMQLEATGLRVLRFRNAEVLSDLEAVVTKVREALTPA